MTAMAAIRSLIDRQGETVVWYRKTLTDRDDVTNWPGVTWRAAGDFDFRDFDCDDFLCDTVEYSIKAMFRRLGSRETDQHAGRMTEQRIQMETYAEVEHLDRVVVDGLIYEVETRPVVHDIRGTYRYRTCMLVWVGEE